MLPQQEELGLMDNGAVLATKGIESAAEIRRNFESANERCACCDGAPARIKELPWHAVKSCGNGYSFARPNGVRKGEQGALLRKLRDADDGGHFNTRRGVDTGTQGGFEGVESGELEGEGVLGLA